MLEVIRWILVGASIAVAGYSLIETIRYKKKFKKAEAENAKVLYEAVTGEDFDE